MPAAAQSASRQTSILGGGHSRPRILWGLTVSLAWILAGCVDLTEPWKKGSLASEAGAGGGVAGTGLDGASSDAGPEDSLTMAGLDSGRVVVDAASNEVSAAADAPVFEPDADRGVPPSVDGSPGTDGSVADSANPGSGGAAGRLDSASDSPAIASGGAGGANGSSGKGGAGGGTGGNTVPGSGEAVGTGGVSSSGGAAGADALTVKDVAPDTGPDVGPEVGPDAIPDLAPGVADAAPLPPGLVAYYPCEGAQSDGTTLTDQSGNGNDATLSTRGGTGTGYGFGTGKVGNALVLTASGSGYVNLPLKVFAGATDITIATWVKVATTQDHQRVFDIGINAGRDTPATTGMVYMYLMPYRASAGKMMFGIATNGLNAEQTMSSSTVGPSDGWTHLAIVLGAGSTRLFVNGVSAVSSTTTTLRPKDLGVIDYAWIGRSQFGADPTFDGSFDEFRVYNRALSAAEVTAIYQYAQP